MLSDNFNPLTDHSQNFQVSCSVHPLLFPIRKAFAMTCKIKCCMVALTDMQSTNYTDKSVTQMTQGSDRVIQQMFKIRNQSLLLKDSTRD